MAQIFILGASTAHGVGGEDGGWADMLKRHIHAQMYAEGGIGEVHQVYNFAKPAVTAQFVRDTFPAQLQHYGNPGRKVAIVSVGGNNAKAVDRPDNFVSSPEGYRAEMAALLAELHAGFDQVIVPGNLICDETKTLPKRNPYGGLSYFWNERTAMFGEVLRELCVQSGAEFVDVPVDARQWIAECLCPDGLHANAKGHRAIFEAVVPHLKL